MAAILNFQKEIQKDLVKVCSDYCKYSKECEDYFNNHPDDVKDYKFDECPIMGLFADM
ncbi:MAG: hypothetical protein J6A73_04695 [Lachnospiraceae bacterium]|nr:hypothetical protein [Lachnospiraceae bacterium]